jgi:hypothetical protein
MRVSEDAKELFWVLVVGAESHCDAPFPLMNSRPDDDDDTMMMKNISIHRELITFGTWFILISNIEISFCIFLD